RLNASIKQRDHDLVVADDGNGSAAGLGGALHNVDVGAVLVMHIHIDGGESIDWSAEVAGNTQGFHKHLGHHDSAAQVQHNSPVVDGGQNAGKQTEIAHAAFTIGLAIARRVLVNGIGAKSHMNRKWHTQAVGIGQYADAFIFGQQVAQTATIAFAQTAT